MVAMHPPENHEPHRPSAERPELVPMPFCSEGLVQHGEVVPVRLSAQVPMKGHFLCVDPVRSGSFRVRAIFVGYASQKKSFEQGQLAPTKDPVFLDLETADVGERITLYVENTSPTPKRFHAGMVVELPREWEPDKRVLERLGVFGARRDAPPSLERFPVLFDSRDWIPAGGTSSVQVPIETQLLLADRLVMHARSLDAFDLVNLSVGSQSLPIPGLDYAGIPGCLYGPDVHYPLVCTVVPHGQLITLHVRNHTDQPQRFIGDLTGKAYVSKNFDLATYMEFYHAIPPDRPLPPSEPAWRPTSAAPAPETRPPTIMTRISERISSWLGVPL